jgi:hypothetical protein
MRYYSYVCTAAITLSLFAGANATLVASPASELAEALARYAEKETAGKGARTLSKEVAETTIEGVAEQVLKDGGEEGLKQVSKLAAKCGPDVIHAIENTPAVVPVLRALETMPEEQLPKAIARLAAGQQGKELAETTIRFGGKALRAEVAHPGVGGRLVRAFGEDGAALCNKCTTDEVIALGRHMDGLASVPESQRKSLLELIAKDKDRFFTWLGRFVEANPGKTIGSVTFLAVFLPNAEGILGGDQVIFDPDGKPKVVSKPGIVGRVGEPFTKPATEGLSWLTRGIAIVVVGWIAVFAAIKLLGVWRRERTRNAETAKRT